MDSWHGVDVDGVITITGDFFFMIPFKSVADGGGNAEPWQSNTDFEGSHRVWTWVNPEDPIEEISLEPAWDCGNVANMTHDQQFEIRNGKVINETSSLMR